MPRLLAVAPSSGSGRRPVSRPPAMHPVGFWLVAYAFAAVMFGSALPSPLYPGYEARFGFGPLTITLIYAVFAGGVLAALLLVGRASDTIGRKRVLLPGLGVAALSAVLFIAAGAAHSGGLGLLVAARVCSGVAAGVFTGTATAALADLDTGGTDQRTALVAALTNLVGTGAGPLVGGVFTRWIALPMQAVFILHLGLVALGLAAVAAVPETVPAAGRRRLQVQRLHVPPEVRAVFAPAAAAAFAGYAVAGLFVAVTPALLTALGHHDPALTGLVIAVLFAAALIGTLLSRALSTLRALLAGTGLLICALAVLAVALAATSLPLLVVAAVTAGGSQGLAFRPALELVTGASPPDHRASVSSSFFAVCYVGGTSLPVLGVGLAAEHLGLVHTGELFAGIVAALAAAALAGLVRSGVTAPNRRAAEPQRSSAPGPEYLSRGRG